MTSYFGRTASQTATLVIYKDLLLTRRRYLSTLTQLTPSILFLSLLFLLNALILPSPSPLFPPPTPFPPVRACSPGPVPCLDLVWGPHDNPVVASLVAALFPPPAATRAFPSRPALVQWVLANPNTTSAALFFNSTGDIVLPENSNIGPGVPARLVKLELMTNASDPDPLARPALLAKIQAYLTGALMNANGSRPLVSDDIAHPFDIRWSSMEIPIRTSSKLVSAVQIGGGSFVFMGVAFNLIAIMRALAAEREEKLRLHLKTMAVGDAAYWAALSILHVSIAVLNSLLTLATGAAFGFRVFTHVNVAVSILYLAMFGIAMVALAFCLSTLIATSRTALVVGIMFLVAFMNIVAFLAVNSFVYILYKPSVPSAIRRILAFLPPFSFSKLWVDITNVTYGYTDFMTGKHVEGRNFHWNDLYKTTQAGLVLAGPSVPPPIDAVYTLMWNTALFALLTWWCDQVLSSGVGSNRPWYFPLTLRYWGLAPLAGTQLAAKIRDQPDHGLDPTVNSSTGGRPGPWLSDPDLAVEVNAACQMNSVISVVDLHKVYTPSWKRARWYRIVSCIGWRWIAILFRKIVGSSSSDSDKPKGPVHAVNGLYLTLREGELVSMVGGNGCGKSTTLSMLTGQIPPTEGHVVFNIEGRLYDAVKDQDALRHHVSICPQFDITWSDLTGAEHVRLFHLLRGGSSSNLEEIVQSTLADVSLAQVGDEAVGSYSGGMRRRLCVALSLLGDSIKVWLADEATTGTDPLHRDEIMAMVFRKARGGADRMSVVWVTHSMEEADRLGDRVAIMAKGQLRAVGDTLTLKSRYGKGYHLGVLCSPDSVASLSVDVERMGGVVEHTAAGSITVSVADPSHVVPLCRFLESSPLVSDFTLAHTTLEEVFLRATSDAAAIANSDEYE